MALSPHRAFDPLLHRAARLTSIITTIEAEVAGAFSMPILSVLDDPMPLEITGGLLPGRCEAARSFKAAAEAAVAAQQRRGSHLAAQAHRPRVSGGSDDAGRLVDCCHPPASQLSENGEWPVAFSRVVCTSARVPCAFLTR